MKLGLENKERAMINRGTSGAVKSKIHRLKSRVCIASILLAG